MGDALSACDWMLATAESCTGGGVGEYLTRVPGASSWYAGGVISYTNRVKSDVLGVDKALIELHGAVSDAVVCAMVQGVLRSLNADIGVAVSGIAGPDGGSPEKPVGTVWFAWCVAGAVPSSRMCCFVGNRTLIRAQAVECALDGLLALTTGSVHTGAIATSD